MRVFKAFIRMIFGELYSYCIQNLNVAKYSVRYPYCKYHRNISLHNVELSKYNVIFNNVVILNSIIESHTYIQHDTVVVNAKIGKFCSIAPRVTIGPGIHETGKVSTHPSFYLRNTPLEKVFSKQDNVITSKLTIIGNDVWIGQNAIILDGVHIGDGAIIAAGAIVNKDVAPYSVVGGVPGRHIKYRFDPETIMLLEKSEWWNYSDEWFEENADMMLNTEKFIEYLKCL